jgi:hypothetical protein
MFMASLYGALGEASPSFGIVAVLLLVVGVARLAVEARGNTVHFPHPLAFLAAFLGVGLHVYENTQSDSAFSAGWVLWSSVPYGVCLLVSSFGATRMPAAVAAAVALALDLFAHFTVFVHPTSSRASLALIFVPIWSAMVFVPAAIVLSWLVLKRRSENNNAP